MSLYSHPSALIVTLLQLLILCLAWISFVSVVQLHALLTRHTTLWLSIHSNSSKFSLGMFQMRENKVTAAPEGGCLQGTRTPDWARLVTQVLHMCDSGVQQACRHHRGGRRHGTAPRISSASTEALATAVVDVVWNLNCLYSGFDLNTEGQRCFHRSSHISK